MSIDEDKKQHEVELNRERNRRYRRRMSPEARANKARKESQRRAEKKLLLTEEQLNGRRVCTRCFKKKLPSEFSYNKHRVSPELNKICDACLVGIYITEGYKASFGSPAFWRKKAYSANCTAISRYRRTSECTSIQKLAGKVSGEQLCILFNQQGGICRYCGLDLVSNTLQLDHRVPLSKGGGHDISNVDFVCADCNRMKHDRSESEFTQALRDLAKRVLARYSQESTEPRDKEPAG